jgi:mannose-6-phosphate isomerase-like protein (cupin superfamily)
MIMRTWRGVTRTSDADRYLEYLRQTGLKAYAATPGNQGATVCRRSMNGGELTEFLLCSRWESMEAIRSFTGGEEARAVFFPEDDRFLVQRDETVAHYEIADEGPHGAPMVPPLEVVDLLVMGSASTTAYHNVVVNEVNDACLRLATFEGEYPWHLHPNSNELFVVVSGVLEIDLADGRTLRLAPWQATTVPAGVVHRTRTIGRTVNLTVERSTTSTTFIDRERLPPAP